MDIQDDAYLLEALEEMEIIEEKKRKAEFTESESFKKIKSVRWYWKVFYWCMEVNIDKHLNGCSIMTFETAKPILPDSNDVLCYNLNQVIIHNEMSF